MPKTESTAPRVQRVRWRDRVQVWGMALATMLTVVLGLIVVTSNLDGSQTATDAVADEESGGGSEGSEDGDGATGSEQSDVRAVLIGDEWASGTGVGEAEAAYPAIAEEKIGWTISVDAVPGSGWTNSGTDIPLSRFADRAGRLNDGAAAPQVVIFSAQTPAGAPLTEVREGIDKAIEAVRTQLPNATTVVLLPVANKRNPTLCPDDAKDDVDVVCVDTYAEEWLRPGKRAGLINNSNDAPNKEGHERLGSLLADTLASIELTDV